jgi:hypothetical protein
MMIDPSYQPPDPGPLPASPKEYVRKGGVLTAEYPAASTVVVVTATFGRGSRPVTVQLQHPDTTQAEWYFRHFDGHDADYWWHRLQREWVRTLVWD